MYRAKTDAFIEEKREDYFTDLSRLVAIDSSCGAKEDGYPYGRGPANALEAALSRAESLGLYTENWENYLGIVQFWPGEERQLDILAHLDVVSAGEGWTKTEPFVMKEEDGRVYGRGTSDDKGPALAALYAMAAVKAAGVSLQHNARLVLGCDEERGSSDLEYYFSRTDFAPMSFSPDARYPIVNTEKGLFSVKGRGNAEEVAYPGIVKLDGGTAGNVVPDRCEARIRGLTAAAIAAAAQHTEEITGIHFEVKEVGAENVEILAKGVSAHGSEPQKGNNVNTAMLELLHALPLAASPVQKWIETLHGCFPHGDYYGEKAGICVEDQISGQLTISLNMLRSNGKMLQFVVDGRVPMAAEEERLTKLAEILNASGLACQTSFSPPHHVPEESPLIGTLLQCYEMYTGKRGYCYAVGSGTYVHNIPGGVAFGCVPEDMDTNMHGPDEFADSEALIMSSKLFASVLIELCGH